MSEAIDLKKLSACIHCGLCLEACPTYRETGEEMSSPRGRLYLMRNYTEGTIAANDPEFAKHELSCLVCRSCETACPSGVEFGLLMEQTRTIIVEHNRSFSKKFIYSKLLRSKPLLKVLQTAAALASKTGLVKFAAKLFPRSTSTGAAMSLAPASIAFPKSRPDLHRSKHPNWKRVGLLLGCIGDAFTSQVNDATIKVLNALGYDVDVLPRVTCCGALAAHGGYLDVTRDLARQNVAVFKHDQLDYILSNIAGCGAMLKEYVHLLEGTSQSVDAHTARKKTFDINELLYLRHREDLSALLNAKFSGKRIAYQAPCHLTHGQQIVNEPLELLRLLPGADAHALEENELCCGSAGSYNIEHPGMAEALRKRKMQLIEDAQPDIIATANAGCMLQLSKENPTPVRHVIELLAEALAVTP